MKQSKRKIRKTNIRKRTKKYNYRKIQRGGMLSSGDKYQISDFMQSLSQSETVSIMFPYDNIHMDIAFPIKSLDQYINKNYQGLRNDELKTIGLGEADLDFNDIPNVPNFITNPYDISELSFPTLQIIERNKFDRKEGILVPISNSTGEPIPRSVIYLIKTMKQLARESQGSAIYLDGEKQPAITHAAPPTAAPTAAPINTSIAPITETCTFFNTLLTKIKTNFNMNISATSESSQSITEKDWNTYFYRIINSFTADDPYLPYFDTFTRQIMEPIEGEHNYPIISYKQAARDDNEARADMEPLKPDDHINHYDDKIQRFLKLPKITNTGNNLLQYIKNKVTVFIYTKNSKIIIQVYTVYYIIIGNIQAKGKGNWKSFLLGDNYRAIKYYQFVIGCVVLIRTVDIIKGTVEYDYEIRWLLNQHTINNMADNGMTMKGFFGNNTQDILLEEDSTFGLKGPRNTTDYSNPSLPGNQIPVATLTEPKKTFDDILRDGFSPQPKQSFSALGPGLQLAPISSIKSSSSAAGVSKEGEETSPLQQHIIVEDYIDNKGNRLSRQNTAEWKDLHVEPVKHTTVTSEGLNMMPKTDVGGRKKNKTRKRSNKKKAKY